MRSSTSLQRIHLSLRDTLTLQPLISITALTYSVFTMGETVTASVALVAVVIVVIVGGVVAEASCQYSVLDVSMIYSHGC